MCHFFFRCVTQHVKDIIKHRMPFVPDCMHMGVFVHDFMFMCIYGSQRHQK